MRASGEEQEEAADEAEEDARRKAPRSWSGEAPAAGLSAAAIAAASPGQRAGKSCPATTFTTSAIWDLTSGEGARARASKRLSRTAALSASGRAPPPEVAASAAAADAFAAAVLPLATHLPLTRFFRAIAAACATCGAASSLSAARRRRAGAAPGESWACFFLFRGGGRG